MAMVVKLPYADFAVVSNPAAAAQATITQAAPASQSQPPNNNNAPIIIVNQVTASLAANATAQTPIHVYLRDGTTGAGTIKWSAILAAPVNGWSIATQVDLNIQCTSGNATLEFEGASVTGAVESVTMSGYFKAYGDA